MSNANPRPLVALISATTAAIGPAVTGLRQHFPDARTWNILDDLLLDEAERTGLTRALSERMARLIDHALQEGAAGVLLTCSMYGEVAQRFRGQPVPVLASDEAAFSAAIGAEYRRVLVVASFDAALADSRTRFAEACRSAGKDVDVAGLVATDAFDAAKRGDTAALATALRNACAPAMGAIDAVLLAQYSLAPAASVLGKELGVPVMSGPACAGAALRTSIGSKAGAQR
jgi:phosphohistidine swiveling domain-containing protein